MSGEPARSAAPARGFIEHTPGFVLSGCIALAVDAAVLTLLTKALGFNPLVARLIAISCAMVAGWRAHRRFTFNVQHPPSFLEFMSYAAVAWFSAAINYAVFATILIAWPETAPLAALILASLVAMTVSYVGMRFGVFKAGPGH